MSKRSGRDAAFIEEMGLGPLWTRRHAPADMPSDGPASGAPAAPVAMPPPDAPDAPAAHAAPADAAAAFTAEDAFAVTGNTSPPAGEVAALDWIPLRAAVAGCVKCGLCNNRHNTVFGVGDEKAKWLFVGEGPGRNEDLQGEPFVGNAGKLLDNMLVAMGLRRGENTFIANIVKCRPTDASGKDRPPTAQEMAACLPYLERQIALLQPTVIVALGKTAAIALLGLDASTPVSKLRGTVHTYAGRPLVVTYHPAYLLRSLGEKRKAWADLCLAMSTHAAA